MIKAYKPVGMTPLELLQLIKADGAAYAGRLDPMAEGLMIYLDKPEEKIKRKDFEKLRKIYEFDVLFGIQTDSYDLLGLPKKPEKYRKEIKLGKRFQEYPPYSYIRVKGKPLFWWARNEKLDEIEIPIKKINIISLELLKKYKISNIELLEYILERVNKVKGDFRQTEIIKQWKAFLNDKSFFNCNKYRIECSGGTYVRSLANELGGVAINIKRLQIGDETLSDVLHLDNDQEAAPSNH